MDKREVFDKAWMDTLQFKIAVSVEHGAVLPKYLGGVVVLDLGQDMTIPTDVTMDEEGISVTLSFNRTPFDCVFPWHSLQAVVTEDWAVSWPLHDTPPAKKVAGLKLVK